MSMCNRLKALPGGSAMEEDSGKVRRKRSQGSGGGVTKRRRKRVEGGWCRKSLRCRPDDIYLGENIRTRGLMRRLPVGALGKQHCHLHRGRRITRAPKHTRCTCIIYYSGCLVWLPRGHLGWQTTGIYGRATGVRTHNDVFVCKEVNVKPAPAH